MPKVTVKKKQQSNKEKQAQQAIGAMIDVMSGSAECVLKEPVGLVLTNTTKTAKPSVESRT